MEGWGTCARILALSWNQMHTVNSASYWDVSAQAECNADMTTLSLIWVVRPSIHIVPVGSLTQTEIWTKIVTFSLWSWLACTSAQLILYISSTTESHTWRYSKHHFNSAVERKDRASEISLSDLNLFSYLCTIKQVHLLSIYRWHFCYARILLYVVQFPENKGLCL